MLLDRKVNINNSKMRIEDPPKSKDKKGEIKVELVCSPSEENKLLLFQALSILIPKENIKNRLLKRNYNDQT